MSLLLNADQWLARENAIYRLTPIDYGCARGA